MNALTVLASGRTSVFVAHRLVSIALDICLRVIIISANWMQMFAPLLLVLDALTNATICC